MPSLPSRPDDHGQVTGQRSFSPDHPRYLMIGPLDSKSPLPMKSKLSSRWSRVVVRTLQLPCDQPSTSHLVLLALTQVPEHSPPSPSRSLRMVCSPFSQITLPYKTHSAHILPAV